MTNIGHIYKLKCSETKRIYIGCTIRTLKKRLNDHRGKGNHCESRDFINPTIELIETIYYTDYEKLLWRERFHIETEDCVNKKIPIRTKQEYKEYKKEWDEEHEGYHKKYKQEHKQERKEKDKKYREKNIEKINAREKVKINCECGGKYQVGSKARHFKTKKHQAFIG